MPEPHPLSPPSAWVVRFARDLPKGRRVLDLACGTGRHTRLLASAGHHLTAIDRDLSGLDDFSPEPGTVEFVEQDLEDGGPWPLGDARFDLIVVTNYLWRPLFPSILAALEDGGMLLYETFAQGNERFGKPTNPDFLLRPDELLAEFGGPLQVLAFEQGEVEDPRPAVTQRICAVRPSQGALPLQDQTG